MLPISFAINQYPLIQLNPKNRKRFPTYSAKKKNFLKAKATLFNAFGPYIIPLSVIPFHTLLSHLQFMYITHLQHIASTTVSVLTYKYTFFIDLNQVMGYKFWIFFLRFVYVLCWESTWDLTLRYEMRLISKLIRYGRCSSLAVMISWFVWLYSYASLNRTDWCGWIVLGIYEKKTIICARGCGKRCN